MRRRDSPIAGVLLTSGDIDQIAGLLSLRELQPFRIYCTASIRRILREDNSIFAMLNRVPDQVLWTEISSDGSFSLLTVAGEDSGIGCTRILAGEPLSGLRFVGSDSASLKPGEALLGVIVTSSSGKRLAYMPAVPAVDDAFCGVWRTPICFCSMGLFGATTN